MGPVEPEELELALARLEWVRATRCLHLPSQHDAWLWHVAQCVEAHHSVDPDVPDRQGT